MNEETKDSGAFATETWKRLLPMILFLIIFNVVEFLTYVTTTIQFLIRLFTGKTNEQLLQFGRGLGNYSRQVIEYLTCASEELPYPFSPWPGALQQIPKDSS